MNNEDITMEKNMQKYENYREQNKRLKKAMNECFYLEALFIEYAIIEDRCNSILRYGGNEIKKDSFVSINSKLKKINKLAENKKALEHKYFSADLIEHILEWKEDRNRLIHALMKQKLTTEGLKELAEVGQDLVKNISNQSIKYKRAIERRNNK